MTTKRHPRAHRRRAVQGDDGVSALLFEFETT